jgi:hypothetical protein
MLLFANVAVAGFASLRDQGLGCRGVVVVLVVLFSTGLFQQG